MFGFKELLSVSVPPHTDFLQEDIVAKTVRLNPVIFYQIDLEGYFRTGWYCYTSRGQTAGDQLRAKSSRSSSVHRPSYTQTSFTMASGWPAAALFYAALRKGSPTKSTFLSASQKTP